jgi:hypothetical protein
VLLWLVWFALAYLCSAYPVRYSLIFEEQQRKFRAQGMAASMYEQTIRNLAFAKQRFDSLSRPLHIFFTLFPICIQTLRELTLVGDEDDKQWAAELLTTMAGERGYEDLMCCAVAADCLILGQRFIRLCDDPDDSVILSGTQALETLHNARVLLLDGAIWLPEAKGTVTHLALSGLQRVGTISFFGGNKPQLVGISWPSPEALALTAPIKQAEVMYKVFQSFFEVNFPSFELSNAFMALDLECPLTMADRQNLLAGIAAHYELDAKELWRLSFNICLSWLSLLPLPSASLLPLLLLLTTDLLCCCVAAAMLLRCCLCCCCCCLCCCCCCCCCC